MMKAMAMAKRKSTDTVTGTELFPEKRTVNRDLVSRFFCACHRVFAIGRNLSIIKAVSKRNVPIFDTRELAIEWLVKQ